MKAFQIKSLAKTCFSLLAILFITACKQCPHGIKTYDPPEYQVRQFFVGGTERVYFDSISGTTDTIRCKTDSIILYDDCNKGNYRTFYYYNFPGNSKDTMDGISVGNIQFGSKVLNGVQFEANGTASIGRFGASQQLSVRRADSLFIAGHLYKDALIFKDTLKGVPYYELITARDKGIISVRYTDTLNHIYINKVLLGL